MPNQPTRKDQDAKNTGHGSLGMGGHPADNPRDLEAGGEGRVNDDRGGGTGPIPGTFGGGPHPGETQGRTV